MVKLCILGCQSEINNFLDIYNKANSMEDTNKVLDTFLDKTIISDVSEDGKEQTVCDRETGECYVIRTKDGLVERINKKYIIEDGRQLLQD
jgi:hypothetical protein